MAPSQMENEMILMSTGKYIHSSVQKLTSGIQGFSPLTGLEEKFGVKRPSGDPGEFKTAFKLETRTLWPTVQSSVRVFITLMVTAA